MMDPNIPKVIISFGLFLDIIGVWLLFKFGMTYEMKQNGLSGWTHPTFDPAKQETKELWADRFGPFALPILIFGFVLQGVGVWWPQLAALHCVIDTTPQ